MDSCESRDTGMGRLDPPRKVFVVGNALLHLMILVKPAYEGYFNPIGSAPFLALSKVFKWDARLRFFILVYARVSRINTKNIGSAPGLALSKCVQRGSRAGLCCLWAKDQRGSRGVKGDQGGSKGIKGGQRGSRGVKGDQGGSKGIKGGQRGSRGVKGDQGRDQKGSIWLSQECVHFSLKKFYYFYG